MTKSVGTPCSLTCFDTHICGPRWTVVSIDREAEFFKSIESSLCSPRHTIITYNVHNLCYISMLHISLFFVVFFVVCFTSYFVFSIAVLPHSPGVVYYHLLLRRETRIPGVAPFSFRIGIWDLFVHRGQKSYTPTAFGKLWTTPGVRCMKHASS